MQRENEIVDVDKLPLKPIPVEEIKAMMQYIAELKKAVMIEGQDYVIDKKKRQYTARSGFQKLALAFSVSDEILEETEVFRNDEFFGWRVRVRVWHPQTGREGTGVGACTIDDENILSKMQYTPGRAAYHDVYSTAHTRALNRAIANIIGSAEVSAEEMGYSNDRKPVDSQQKDQIELPELTTPEWVFKDSVNMQGWDEIETVTLAWIENSGIMTPLEVFEVGHDAVKVWVRNAQGVFLGDNWGHINEMLMAAGFRYNQNEKRWRCNQSDLIPEQEA